MSECLVFSLRKKTLRENTRPYRYHGLKIFTSLRLRFQDFQRWWLQGEYELAEIDNYPDGMVIAHVENSSCFEPKFEEVDNILKIELPMSLLANLVSTPLQKLMSDELPSALSYCPDQYIQSCISTALGGGLGKWLCRLCY